MDPIWIVAAFVFGTVASRIGLPPLVGYLLAGFVLNGFGISGGETLAEIADAGVTLLLFTIGLKLKIRSLGRPEVWAGSMLHMLITVIVFGVGIWILRAAGTPYFNMLSWSTALMVAFALSFSSTVFAVKVFESKREMPSRHGTTAIGILIMQDIIAVVFLAASTGKVPSAWAAALIVGLFFARPLLTRVISRCGHGELLMLFGILMAALGYGSFELVGLKGDLGALVFGVMLANEPKAPELASRLLGFKDLFLVGFFLNIGLSGSPSLMGFGIGILLVLAMPFKAALFFGLLTRFKLRARTSMLTALSLANYSEFGLIVGSIGVANGWIGGEWLTVIAIALSLTFLIAAPLNSSAHTLYARTSDHLKKYESPERLPEDATISTGKAEVGILGMGGIGTAAYDEMQRRFGDVVVGVDFCGDTVKEHLGQGRNVLGGDADDSDFWERFDPADSRINLVMLALPVANASVFAVRQLHQRGYKGRVIASVRYEDQVDILEEAGVDAVYSLYQEAGMGFANHACNHVGICAHHDNNSDSRTMVLDND